MTVALALCAVVAVALVAVVALDNNRTRALRQTLNDRANDLEEFRQATMAQADTYAGNMVRLSQRDSEQLRLVLDALIGDRQRLVTAALAAGPNPMAARTVGQIDQATARPLTRDPANLREYLEETWGERADARDTELQTSDGDPIVPVGM